MNQDDIHSRLTDVFRDVFDDEALSIERSTTAADVEGWDSLTHVNLLVAVEKAFGIRMSTREVKNMKNVGDFIDLIGAKAGA